MIDWNIDSSALAKKGDLISIAASWLGWMASSLVSMKIASLLSMTQKRAEIEWDDRGMKLMEGSRVVIALLEGAARVMVMPFFPLSAAVMRGSFR